MALGVVRWCRTGGPCRRAAPGRQAEVGSLVTDVMGVLDLQASLMPVESPRGEVLGLSVRYPASKRDAMPGDET